MDEVNAQVFHTHGLNWMVASRPLRHRLHVSAVGAARQRLVMPLNTQQAKSRRRSMTIALRLTGAIFSLSSST